MDLEITFGWTAVTKPNCQAGKFFLWYTGVEKQCGLIPQWQLLREKTKQGTGQQAIWCSSSGQQILKLKYVRDDDDVLCGRSASLDSPPRRA